MKVNLICEPKEALPGYVNVTTLSCRVFINDSPYPIEHCPDSWLEPIVKQGEATSLVALKMLEYHDWAAVTILLEHWVSRLAIGGTLEVGCVDILAVAFGLTEGRLSIKDANELLYGGQQKSWDFSCVALTVNQLATALEKLGMKIIKKRQQNYRAIVLAEKA